MSLVANYSGSESEHSASEDDEDTAEATATATSAATIASKSDKTQSSKGDEKSINFLTAEFSESESEGEFSFHDQYGYRVATDNRSCRCCFWFRVG